MDVPFLDLRAQFVVKGFLQGLHASPFHGFSVEFSEHRKYTAGDDPKDIDWLVYAKTDKFYVKKFEAETNITGHLVMDLSRSMGYTYRQELTKFDYSICLAAALCYLMIYQQDPVGLITFDEKVRDSLPPRSKRTQLGNLLSHLSRLEPTGQTDIANSITQIAAMLRHRSLVMIFSDLLTEPEPVIHSLRVLRHGGHVRRHDFEHGCGAAVLLHRLDNRFAGHHASQARRTVKHRELLLRCLQKKLGRIVRCCHHAE